MLTSLQNYTTYSILSGIKEPKDWVARAKECGFNALAISDKKNIYGWINFQIECEKEGIKPILGAEFVVTDNVETKGNQGSVLVYAINEKGIENIIEMNNFSYRKKDEGGGFYFHPRISSEILRTLNEGVICVVPVAKYGYGVGLKKDYTVSRPGKLRALQEVYGDRLYLGYNGFLTPVIKLECILKEFDIRVVPVFDCHFPSPNEAKLYPVVRKMDEAQGRSMKNFDRKFVNGWVPTAADMEGFEWITDQMKMDLEDLVDSCNAKVPTGTYFLPNLFDSPQETEKFLVDQILSNYGRKVGDESFCPASLDEVRSHEVYGARCKQLDYEMDVIRQMGFMDYFAIESAICRNVMDKGFQWGIARGSAGGSEFANMLDIIQLDPIKHGLMFERFLNPDRNDLPDIDSDMCNGGRDESIRFCKELLGEEAVVSIGTFMTLKVVSAIQKIAQAYSYGIPNNDGGVTDYTHESLNNFIAGQHVTATKKGREELEERLEHPKFAEFYERHSKFIEDFVMPLQGTITGTGIHAAGTLLLPHSYKGKLPVQYREGRYISQWRDTDCEKRGFVKYDFLGLTNLSVVGYASKLIEENYGIKIPPADQLDFYDQKVLDVFRSGETDGIFQVNSYLHQKYLPKLRPDSFYDIVAALALVRPGPMGIGVDTSYYLRKNGEEEVTYLHPDLEPILGDTFGLMVYQEQMMKICVVMAGMSKADSDKVRKACGKKKKKDMEKLKPLFVNGGIANGYEEELMESLWEWFISFSEYSFNKSHSVAYALLAWQQAWLKAYYPLEFWCGVLRYASHDDKKQNNIWNARLAAERDGITFEFPNINNFYEDFTPIGNDRIGWPLSAIKGVGNKAVAELTKKGRHSFESLFLMYWSVDQKVVNLGIFKKLIKAGFFAPEGEPYEVVKELHRCRVMDKKKFAIPYEFEKTDPIYWVNQRNDIMGMIVVPWRNAMAQRLSPNVSHILSRDFDQIQDGELLTICGRIDRMFQKKIMGGRNKGMWWAKLVLVDHGVEYKVMLWPGFWDAKNNPAIGTDQCPRPRKGDLIELTVMKDTFSPPDSDRKYHQFVVNDDTCNMRIVHR